MAIDKCNLEELLKDLPSKWRDILIKILLDIQEDIGNVDCDTVRECETLTSLSEFTQNGSQICITYTDEHSVATERCFDLEDVLNNSLDEVNPGCITTPTLWNTMSYIERFQALIDTICNCCPATTTTTTTTSSTTTTTTTAPTTTTTTTSSTTTTTTEATTTTTTTTSSTTTTTTV